MTRNRSSVPTQRARGGRRSALPAFAAPSPERSRNMSAIKGRDTRPEMWVRQALHAAGFRYRLHPPKITGHPDLVLTRYRVAVFVHGCFWHGHKCKIDHIPRTNSAYWRAKIRRNRKRDVRSTGALREQGWTVTALRECSLRKDSAALIKVLERRRAGDDATRGRQRVT